jgi:hypothetical protein
MFSRPTLMVGDNHACDLLMLINICPPRSCYTKRALIIKSACFSKIETGFLVEKAFVVLLQGHSEVASPAFGLRRKRDGYNSM